MWWTDGADGQARLIDGARSFDLNGTTIYLFYNLVLRVYRVKTQIKISFSMRYRSFSYTRYPGIRAGRGQ